MPAGVEDTDTKPIVLIAGTMKLADRLGHHDYLGGCGLAASLLSQTSGVTTEVASWAQPGIETVIRSARAVVVYSNGLGEATNPTTSRQLDLLQQLADHGAGLTMIHRAVRYPHAVASRAMTLIGGAYVAGRSGRGHWPTEHTAFPSHPATRGVRPWRIKDGWLNGIQFVEGMHGITPLLWSSRKYGGARVGGDAAIVAWAYERPTGGRSFCFTGLDAHMAWSVPGLRQLVINGVLWSAGVAIPEHGAPCSADDAFVSKWLTARAPRSWSARRLLRRARDWFGGERG